MFVFVKNLLNWLFPEKCIICSCEISENSVFCSKCFSELNFIDFPICECCGKSQEVSCGDNQICSSCSNFNREFDFCRSLLIYDMFSKKLVMKIKRKADFYVAKKAVKLFLYKYQNLFVNSDIIIPVPSHWTRSLKRGYNPTDIIAKELSKSLKIPLKSNILKRVKRTDYQKNKTLQERIANVEVAFSCKKNLAGSRIILVDDVFTTGATLNECSRILKESGASKVYCMTIASTKS